MVPPKDLSTDCFCCGGPVHLDYTIWVCGICGSGQTSSGISVLAIGKIFWFNAYETEAELRKAMARAEAEALLCR